MNLVTVRYGHVGESATLCASAPGQRSFLIPQGSVRSFDVTIPQIQTSNTQECKNKILEGSKWLICERSPRRAWQCSDPVGRPITTGDFAVADYRWCEASEWFPRIAVWLLEWRTRRRGSGSWAFFDRPSSEKSWAARFLYWTLYPDDRLNASSRPDERRAGKIRMEAERL